MLEQLGGAGDTSMPSHIAWGLRQARVWLDPRGSQAHRCEQKVFLQPSLGPGAVGCAGDVLGELQEPLWLRLCCLSKW